MTMRTPSILALAALLLAAAPGANAVAVYAAGDIAECKKAPVEESGAAATMRLIPDDATVFVLGDSTYPFSDPKSIARCYQPTWGRFLAHTYAVPGNHDYIDNSAADFLHYFGSRNAKHTYFRARVGEWWVFGLDSNINGPALARQARWLKRELAAIEGDGRCIVALWHHALVSTGLHAGDGATMATAWLALDAAGADLVLSGHEHFYESFDPVDVKGTPKPDGIREFVVGTGGAALVDFSLSSRHRVYARVHGVLELELESGHYEWRFRTVDGDVRDAGSATCRRAPRPAGDMGESARQSAK